MPMFSIFSHKYKNEQKFLQSYCTIPHQICTRCTTFTFNALLSCLSEFRYSNLFWKECQRDDENWSVKEANWLPWQHPLSDRQINANVFIKPSHSSTNPKNLVKICSVVHGISLRISQPLKKLY